MGIEFLVEVFLTGPGLGNMALLVVLLLARQAKKKEKKLLYLTVWLGIKSLMISIWFFSIKDTLSSVKCMILSRIYDIGSY